jgi:hypothetical protein
MSMPLSGTAHAADPCEYDGGLRAYIACIAVQAHAALTLAEALDERLDVLDPVAGAAPPQVVYLMDRDASPLCPDTWLELGSGEVWASDTHVNYNRACEVSGCSVLQLEHRDPPEICPAGWEEVAYGSTWVSDTHLNYVRTCARCD